MEDLGLRITLNQIDPVKGKFTFGVSHHPVRTTSSSKPSRSPSSTCSGAARCSWASASALSLRQRRAARAVAPSPTPRAGRAGAVRPPGRGVGRAGG
ncbi:MAG: hypothetical protein WKG07_06450 [Hymenobacter sp.]